MKDIYARFAAIIGCSYSTDELVRLEIMAKAMEKI